MAKSRLISDDIFPNRQGASKVGEEARSVCKLAWQVAQPSESALPVALLAQGHFRSNYATPSTITRDKNPVWYEILGNDNHKDGVTLHLKRSTNKWSKKLEAHAATGENGSTVSGTLASIWRDTEQPGQNELCLRGAKCMSWSRSWLQSEVTSSFAGTMPSAYFYSE